MVKTVALAVAAIALIVGAALWTEDHLALEEARWEAVEELNRVTGTANTAAYMALSAGIVAADALRLDVSYGDGEARIPDKAYRAIIERARKLLAKRGLQTFQTERGDWSVVFSVWPLG